MKWIVLVLTRVGIRCWRYRRAGEIKEDVETADEAAEKD
jgi:hypothetical protein